MMRSLAAIALAACLCLAVFAASAEDKIFAPGSSFKDCEDCPEMVVIPTGSFMMGSAPDEEEYLEEEGPQHQVNIRYKFAVGKFELTRGQFAQFVNATDYSASGGCYYFTGSEWEMRSSNSWRKPGFSQNDNHSLVCVNRNDARAYVDWLSQTSGNSYRLLSEAEWEYAARAGVTTPFRTGGGRKSKNPAKFKGEHSYRGLSKRVYFKRTGAVGRHSPNRFGLYDMAGSIWELVGDCWNNNYQGAPGDGSVWTQGDCGKQVLRGGSWLIFPWPLRPTVRDWISTASRFNYVGFRVARTLSR